MLNYVQFGVYNGILREQMLLHEAELGIYYIVPNPSSKDWVYR